jgi:hypothetical protein
MGNTVLYSVISLVITILKIEFKKCWSCWKYSIYRPIGSAEVNSKYWLNERSGYVVCDRTVAQQKSAECQTVGDTLAQAFRSQ